MKNRSVKDILIACVDELLGFPNTIEVVYPKTKLHQCIIHQIRITTKFVSYIDLKTLMACLKKVYAVPTEDTALLELDMFEEKWKQNYPTIAISWKSN